jgi:hypothetical protein
MARIDWVEAKLLIWARWRVARSGTGGELSHSRAELGSANGGRSGYITAAVPLLEIEAGVTEEGVQGLRPLGLGLTVVEVYCGPGGEAEHLAELKCSRAAMYARIDQAHKQLATFFLERQARQRAERARVEALQPGSFPR